MASGVDISGIFCYNYNMNKTTKRSTSGDVNHISYFEIITFPIWKNVRKMLHLIHKVTTPNRKGNNKMAVATATYKVGDLYTSQKSKVTGTILEIAPNKTGDAVRVKLDVNGNTRWTTWTAK